MATIGAPFRTALITALLAALPTCRSPPISACTTTGPEEIKMISAGMPYLSKAPLSFAIQTPVAMEPMEEYAKTIFLDSAAKLLETTTQLNTARAKIRFFANRFIWRASARARSTEITQTAAKNLHPFGSLDVFCELILVLARVEHMFSLGRSLRIERFDLCANKMRPVVLERRLNFLAKRRDILNQVRARDAAAFGHFLQLHLATGRGSHTRFLFMAAKIIAI